MASYKKIAIVTGSAGFIGFHMSKKLLDEGWKVVGIDNLNPYYDISLKSKRHEILKKNKLEILRTKMLSKMLLNILSLTYLSI